MAATIKYLLDNERPKCVIGTHFQELQDPNVLPIYPDLQFLKMNYLIQQENGNLEIVFLYK